MPWDGEDARTTAAAARMTRPTSRIMKAAARHVRPHARAAEVPQRGRVRRPGRSGDMQRRHGGCWLHGCCG